MRAVRRSTMIRRVLGLIVVTAFLVALVLLLRIVRPVEGQTPAGTAAGAAAATPWGEPDLQGIWTGTPTNPCSDLPGSPTRSSSPTRNGPNSTSNEPTSSAATPLEDRRTLSGKGSAEQDVGGAYNAAIFTSHLRLGRRTSMIVDPPNGRLPASHTGGAEEASRDAGVFAGSQASHRGLQEQAARVRRRQVRTAVAAARGGRLRTTSRAGLACRAAAVASSAVPTARRIVVTASAA